MGNPSKSPFSSVGAKAVLADACREVGLKSGDAELLRLGENAIFRLADSTVVRIARSADVMSDAAKEVRVSRWLHEAGMPAAQLADVAQPILVEGHPVTFWQFIPGSGKKASTVDLAAMLRRLHKLPVPAEVELPPHHMFRRVAERIREATDVPDDDLAFLTEQLHELQAQYVKLEFPLSSSAVHADAHIQNIILTPSGEAILIDFEGFAFGPPETDLSVTATEYGVGWHTDDAYSAFCRTYGFDVRSWEGFATLQRANLLKMTSWLMQNVAESEAVAAQFQARMSTLRDPEKPASWQPF